MDKDDRVTVSQISGLVQAHESDQARLPVAGETLLSQYKQCNAVNDQQLRDVKNIKDLVQINVKTLDKKLFVSSRGQKRGAGPPAGDETSYNLAFDPINFLQKVPCMGDREFLVNQSILHNSTTKNRVSEAASRQKFMQQHHMAATARARYQAPGTTKSSANRGLQHLLPQLPTAGGFNLRAPRQGIKSTQTARASNYRSLQVHRFEQPETIEKGEPVEETEDEVESVQLSGRGSQIDPVRCLKNIFQKHEVRKRRPGVNRIAEKYKQLAKSTGSYGGGPGSRIATANTIEHSPWDGALGSIAGSFSGVGESQATRGFDPTSSSYKQSPRHSQPSYGARPTNTAGNPILLQRGDSRQQPAFQPPATAGAAMGQGRTRVRGMGSLGPEQEGSQTARARFQSSHDVNQVPRGFQPIGLPAESTEQPSIGRNPDLPQTDWPTQPSRGTAGGSTAKHEISQRSQLEDKQRRPATIAPILTDGLSETQAAIRTKLERMRQLFEDEDSKREGQQASEGGLHRPESSEWDLHNHRLAYEEAMEKRQRHLDAFEASRKPQNPNTGRADTSSRDHPSAPAENEAQPTGAEMAEEELRDFLQDRLAELDDGANADKSATGTGRFKFRASTISNVLPSGHVTEQSRLAANYKKRVRKGEQLHQKLVNMQQRRIQQRSSALRQSHERIMEAHRKEVVSSRSRDRCSPSNGSDPGSPLFVNAAAAARGETTFSIASRSSRRQRSKQRRRLVNTDLQGGGEEPVISEDGRISTQKASHAHPTTQSPKTPRDDSGVFKIKPEAQLEPSQLALQAVQSESHTNRANINTDIDDQNLSSGAIQIQDDDDPRGERRSESTAVIFMVDNNSTMLPNNKRVNYFTQVLRQIEAIDRQYVKKHVKQNRGPYDRSDLAHEIPQVTQQTNSARRSVETDVKDGEASVAQILQESDSDGRGATALDELMERSLGDALQRHAQETGARPEDVLILQVADERSTSKDDRASRETSKLKSKTLSSKELSQSQNRPLVEKASRSQSHASNKSQVNTVDLANSSEGVVAPVVQAVRVTTNAAEPQRASEVTASGERASPASSNALVARGQKYSHGKPGSAVGAMPVANETLDTDPLSVEEAEPVETRPQEASSEELKPPEQNYGSETEKVPTESRVVGDGPGVASSHRGSITSGPQPDLEQLPGPAGWRADNLASVTPRMPAAAVTGPQMAYFCPKRFNRLPRFTIFFKKGQKASQSRYVNENTVSLNADFLKFLSDKRGAPAESKAASEGQLNEATPEATPGKEQEATESESRQKSAVKEGESAAADAGDKGMAKVPSDVAQWNDYLRQRKFDPFDRVVLVKGIDNSILTSFRTLRGENNTVSDTFKIVHKKFQPGKVNAAYYKSQVGSRGDKGLYSTQYSRIEDIIGAEEGIEEDGGFEIFHQNADGTFEHIASRREERKEPLVLNVNPDIDAAKDSREEFSPSKLQHAITAALIDIDKEGGADTGRQAADGQERRSPFKAVAQTDGAMILGHSRDVASTESFSYAVKQKSRMPRPKPLHLQGKSRGIQKVDEQSQVASPDTLLAGPAFGVTGVSPLTQLANTMLREQQVRGTDLPMPQPPPGSHQSNRVRGGQRAEFASIQEQQKLASTQPHSFGVTANIIGGTQQARRPSEGGPQVRANPVRLIMQPNFQFNSAATVENIPDQEPLDEKDKSDHRFKSAASKSQGGGAFPNGRKSRVTEATLLALEGNVTYMSNRNTAGPTALLNKTDTQPRAGLQGKDSIGDKHTTPVSMSAAQKTLFADGQRSPEATEYLAAQRFGTQVSGFPSESDAARTALKASAGKAAANGEDVNRSQHLAMDNSNDHANVSADRRGYLYPNKPISPPTVNVIKSDVQFVTDFNESHQADEGREQADAKAENLDLLVGSPVVHQALGGRKLHAKQAEPAPQADSTAGKTSPRALWNKSVPAASTGRAAVNSRKAAPTPSAHVGALKIPESLQGVQFMGDNALAEVAAGNGAKKGAVGSMIDKIYVKDRKMINGAHKGNMLSTAVLTDMSRYHKVRSGTGVETKTYDDVWLQARIDEEAEEIGLRLDCAPPLGVTAAQSQLKQPVATEQSGAPLSGTSTQPDQQASPKGSMAKLRQSLLGAGAADIGKISQEPAEGVAHSYGELVNRSDQGTALARSAYQ